LTNPNPDWDTFEYDFALRCWDKAYKEDEKRFYNTKYQHQQLVNNIRKNRE
jgi:hypothetical protein